jgi:hypothetical protein
LEEVIFIIETTAARSSAESLVSCLRPSLATKYTAALGKRLLLQGSALGLLEMGEEDTVVVGVAEGVAVGVTEGVAVGVTERTVVDVTVGDEGFGEGVVDGVEEGVEGEVDGVEVVDGLTVRVAYKRQGYKEKDK